MGYRSAMPPDRHPGATDLPDLRAAWPPAVPGETRGYRPLDLAGTQPVALCDLGEGRFVAVVEWPSEALTALPCVRAGETWRVAGAGDGVALTVLAGLESPGWQLPSGFELRRYDTRPFVPGDERALGTDQSNISVIVGDRAIVKWRSAPDADGRRATRLRRHVQANGFSRTPPLLASLAWADAAEQTWILADVDELLHEATDGWDDGIERLRSVLASPGADDMSYARSLGRLTAELHTALLAASAVITRPTRAATPEEMIDIRTAGLDLLERTVAIDAEDRVEVVDRAPLLRAAIEGTPGDTTTLGPIHGDLHIGQLVAWRGGLDVIDFDGAPHPTAPAGDLDAPARDVAQMLCSLWSLAAIVDQRTDGAQAERLRAWAALAESAFLVSYRAGLAMTDHDSFDERMLEPLVAEQICRELLYAEATLPRWRYAPLQALRWRYPLRHEDDD